MLDMKITRVWAMPNSETFSIKTIREFVCRYLGPVTVDPYARNCELATHRNDLNPNTTAQHHMDAIDYLKMLADDGLQADTVLIDPPYSPRQVKECYDGIGVKMKQTDALRGAVMAMRNAQVDRLLRQGGHVLTFGWNTNGMGKKHGYTIKEILLVAHGSDHNDTICMCEIKS